MQDGSESPKVSAEELSLSRLHTIRGEVRAASLGFAILGSYAYIYGFIYWCYGYDFSYLSPPATIGETAFLVAILLVLLSKFLSVKMGYDVPNKLPLPTVLVAAGCFLILGGLYFGGSSSPWTLGYQDRGIMLAGAFILAIGTVHALTYSGARTRASPKVPLGPKWWVVRAITVAGIVLVGIILIVTLYPISACVTTLAG